MLKKFFQGDSALSRLKLFLLLYGILLTGIILVKLSYSKDDIYFFINGLHQPYLDVFFTYVTDLGAVVTSIVICILLLFVSYRSSLLMSTAYALTSIVNFSLKYLVAAPRPAIYFKDSTRVIYHVPNVALLANNFSFPSGHSVGAFTSAVVLSYLYPRKTVLFFILAVLVAYSRMYLSEHFFEDVSAGSFEAVVLVTGWMGWFGEKAFLKKPMWDKSLKDAY
jgi:membrane-associated phospholipid phosphatase